MSTNMNELRKVIDDSRDIDSLADDMGKVYRELMFKGVKESILYEVLSCPNELAEYICRDDDNKEMFIDKLEYILIRLKQ